MLVIDNAGFHRGKGVEIPKGLYLKGLPPYSPQLQPAERLWSLVNEVVVNRHFSTIDALEKALVERCVKLQSMCQSLIQRVTSYHWWPRCNLKEKPINSR